MQITNPILAIDYGKKKIGLAISDPKGIIASPLDVLHITEKKNEDSVIGEILQIAQEYRVKTILLGMPQEFKKSHKKTSNRIESFKEKISILTDLPIVTYDESYSTIEAQNMLLSLGQNSKSSKGKIDKIAATVFLQEFLNSQEKKNEISC